MVDALERAIHHLHRGGLLIDMRPDSGRRPRLLSDGHVVGHFLTTREVTLDDETADRAIARLVRRGVLRKVDRGHLWHQTSFGDRRELVQYLRESARYSGLSPGTLARIDADAGPLAMRRAIKFEVLARA